ncbi:MAG TPA: hypothetical protein VMZ52_15230 [Bryobacteraceae bacterium]|nr:hypothetical protein [Bryobacteraceae bacterium]
MARVTRGVAADDSLLQAALEGLEAQKMRIEEQIRRVQGMLRQGRRGRPAAAGVDGASAAESERPKRVLSAAARKRIAAAQKKRWANFRKSEQGK